MRRLHGGELLAGVGAVGLLAALFLDWFAGAGSGAGDSGWSSLGWLMVALLVLAALAALWLVAATARHAVTQSVSAGVSAAPFGALVALVLLVRVVTQPDLGVGAPNDLVEVEAGAYVGLLFAALIPVGAWWSLADERTAAGESRYVPPAPRPAPPAP